MKTILIPTDFSEESLYGLETAAFIARKFKAVIHLFNAVETGSFYFASEPLFIAPPAAVMIEGIDSSLIKKSLEKLEAIKKRKVLAGINVKLSAVTTTNIHVSILEYSDKIKSDLVIMGSKGSGSIAGVLLGSTAERVVRFSERPVLVVPVKQKKSVPKLLVFASDFKEEAYGIFPFIRDFARIFNSKIHLLKINTSDNFTRTKDDEALITNFNKKFGGKYEYRIYNDYMKEEGILNYSDEIKADVIAIGTHGKKGLRRFFSEDVSEGIVRLSTKLILIVNLKKFKNKHDILK
jgi:nucleotide-binding universal stress UspA family protein